MGIIKRTSLIAVICGAPIVEILLSDLIYRYQGIRSGTFGYFLIFLGATAGTFAFYKIISHSRSVVIMSAIYFVFAIVIEVIGAIFVSCFFYHDCL